MKRAFWLLISGIWFIFVTIACLTGDYQGGMNASFMMMLSLVMSQVDGLKGEIKEMSVDNSKLVCYNATKEKGQQMDGSWVVEVRKDDADDGEQGGFSKRG